MKTLLKLCVISSFAYSALCLASSVNLNLNLGVAFSQLSNTSTVTPIQGLTNTYNTNKKTRTAGFLGAGVEYVFDHLASRPFDLGLGVSGFFTDLGDLSGTETPGSNLGLTDTLNYTMKARSSALLAQSRLIYTQHALQPYLLAGAGYSRNTLSNFTESTVSGSNAAPSNPYTNHTEGSFAYELGAGIQYILMAKAHSDILLGIEYRYLNLGKAELGPTSSQTNNDRLTSKNISTQLVGLNLTYQF